MEEECEDFGAMMNDYFNKFTKVKKRNHYFSMHLYDLVDILSLRPSMSVWSKFVSEKIPEDVESELFSMLIEYALSQHPDKYEGRISLLMSLVEDLLFYNNKLTPGGNIDRLRHDVKMYMKELELRLNKITKNILNNLNPFPIVALSCGKDANEYFLHNSIGLYHIEKICVGFKGNNCIATLTLLILERREYGNN